MIQSWCFGIYIEHEPRPDSKTQYALLQGQMGDSPDKGIKRQELVAISGVLPLVNALCVTPTNRVKAA